MRRKRKNISQCKVEAAENKKQWYKPCQHKGATGQYGGPLPETTPTPAFNPPRSPTVPFPKYVVAVASPGVTLDQVHSWDVDPIPAKKSRSWDHDPSCFLGAGITPVVGQQIPAEILQLCIWIMR